MTPPAERAPSKRALDGGAATVGGLVCAHAAGRRCRSSAACGALYLDGGSGLLHTPTGSGKTLAAFGGPLLEALASQRGRASGVQPTPSKRRRVSPEAALRCCGSPRCARSPPTRCARCASRSTRWASTGRSACAPAMPARATSAWRAPGKLDVLVTTPESLSLLLSYPDTARAVRRPALRHRRRVARAARQQARRAAAACAGAVARAGARAADLGPVGDAGQPGRGARRAAAARCRTRRSVAGVAPRPLTLRHAAPRTRASASRGPATSACRSCSAWSSACSPCAPACCSPTPARRPSCGTRRCRRCGPRTPDTLALHHGSLDPKLRAAAEAGPARRQRPLRRRDFQPRPGRGLSRRRPGAADRQPQGRRRACCNAPAARRTGRARPGTIVCVPTHALELVEYAAARSAMARGDDRSAPAAAAVAWTCWPSTA